MGDGYYLFTQKMSGDLGSKMFHQGTTDDLPCICSNAVFFSA